MTQWKYVCQAIGVVIVVVIPDAWSSAEPHTPANAARPGRVLEADSAAHPPRDSDTDRSKVVGKGVYTLQQSKGMDGFPLIHPILRPDLKESDLLEFARKNPESELADDVLFRAAEVLVNRKEYGQAIRVLDTIIERYPYSAHVDKEVLFGLLFSVPGSPCEITEAKEALSLHVREHPDFTADEALRCKALIWEMLGKRGEAIRLLQQYADKHPLGRWAAEDSEARPRFRSFRSLYRTHELIFHHLAWLYYQSGNLIKAESVLTQAIKNFVGSRYTVSYYDLLARTHEKTGNVAKEVDALRHLREMMQRSEQDRVGIIGSADRAELPECERWRVWLRVRPPEKVESRLRELKAIEDGRAKDGTQERPKAEVPRQP